jgi:hypothetical protein
LSLEIQSIAPSPNQPNTWSVPIPSLPQLLTGAGNGHATAVVVDADGTVRLTGSTTPIVQGDVLVQNHQTTAQSINTSSPFTAGGDVLVVASNNLLAGKILSGSGDGYGSDGGNITLTALGNISTDNLVSFATSGKAGDIRLTSVTGAIDTTAGTLEATSGNGSGGNVTLQAASDIRTGEINTFAEDGDVSNSHFKTYVLSSGQCC